MNDFVIGERLSGGEMKIHHHIKRFIDMREKKRDMFVWVETTNNKVLKTEIRNIFEEDQHGFLGVSNRTVMDELGMEPFRVDKDSWHYRFIMMFKTTEPKDFCSYWRSFTLLSILTILAATIAGFFLFFIGLVMVTEPIWTVAVIAAIVLLLCVLKIVDDHVTKKQLEKLYESDNKSFEEKNVKEVGLFRKAFRQWKSKTCSFVSYS